MEIHKINPGNTTQYYTTITLSDVHQTFTKEMERGQVKR